MKVLLIDPWCSDDFNAYALGLCDGMSKQVDLTLVSAFNLTVKSNAYKVIPTFFKRSNKMGRSAFRSVLRGIEYILGYIKLLRIAKKEGFDVLHLQWALLNKIDVFFLKRLRKYVRLSVFTAHNAIPHINGEKEINGLKKLYSCFDLILLHGEGIKKEFLTFFPEYEAKILIQNHGVYLTQQTSYNRENVGDDILKACEVGSGKTACFVGNIFYNKGTDRLIKYWLEQQKETDNKLVVSGEVIESFEELTQLEGLIKESKNIFYIPRRTNNDEFACILASSDMVVLPYRHASMSGVVYSAAAFSKPILYTDVGAIGEYMTEKGSICSENSDEELFIKLDLALNTPKENLISMGKELNRHIYENYDWVRIAEKLFAEGYQKGIANK